MNTDESCPDCEQVPCLCEEWERQLAAIEYRDAEAACEMAATMLPYLWVEGSDGLLRKRKS